MKKLIVLVMFSAGLLFAQAQNTGNPTTQNRNSTTQQPPQSYERMLQNNQKMEFKSQMAKTLGLTDQQLKDFDPIYKEYMTKQSALANRRIELLNRYVRDTMSGNSPTLNSQRLAFQNDYQQLQNDEMSLRKEYYDKFQGVISPNNASGFFMLEDVAAYPIYSNILGQRYAPYINMDRNSYFNNGNSTDPRPNTNNNLNNNTIPQNRNQNSTNGSQNGSGNDSNVPKNNKPTTPPRE